MYIYIYLCVHRKYTYVCVAICKTIYIYIYIYTESLGKSGCLTAAKMHENSHPSNGLCRVWQLLTMSELTMTGCEAVRSRHGITNAINDGIAIINHPPAITIFMGGIPTINFLAGLLIIAIPTLPVWESFHMNFRCFTIRSFSLRHRSKLCLLLGGSSHKS